MDLFAWRTAHKFSETDKVNILSHIFVICWIDQNLDEITCSTEGYFRWNKSDQFEFEKVNEIRKRGKKTETVLQI